MIITSTKKKKKDEDIAPVLSKETKQAIKNTVSQKAKDIVNASPIGKIKNTFSDGYQVGDVTKTILNVGNMLNPISMVKNKASEIGSTVGTSVKNNKGNFVKSTKSKEKIKNIWDDGYQLGDVSKTFFNIEKSVLGTAGDVAANLAKGELQTAEGLVDTGRYLLSDITKYTNPALSVRARRNAIQNTTGVILGENDMYNQPKENGWTKKLDEYSISGNALDNIIQSVGQQAFRVGLQGAVGMTGASEGATAAFNKLEIFAGSYGSSKSQALMNGADDTTATIKGFIGGTSEYISENLFDSIPGFKTGELKGITKVKDLIGKSAEKTFGKTAGKAMIRVFSALGEGTEERISNGLETALTDIVNAINPSYAYGMEEGQGLTESTFGKNALKLFQDTFKSAFSKESNEAFVSAFFSTLITGAIADTMTAADRNKVIKAYAKDNNITNEQATELFDGITELRTQQIADETTSYEDATNIKEQVSKQLTEEIRNDKKFSLAELQEGLIARDKFTKAVGTGVVSSRGLDLVESYKAYNGDTKYKNEIANIQKFMNNRNIDARFDATMFENNEQNAIWTTENGQDSVVFNPNASQDQVIQSIATHEMTHDIINQKTEAGTSLFNDVLENIKTQENYAKDRQEIEDLYAKYYDRNSEDFAAKVDEEMVANELGKNLGTQEYINRLVNEKPNLAKRIYNWVVDKLDNIGKSEEYKEQKAYWKSVADKFEVAYNEQKTATSEDKTAYDISYRGSHQIENAKSITELNIDDVKNKVIEIDGYLTNQAQSDLKKLQKILNNPSEKVKIYRASPVNELNNGDWVTTDKSYAQNVAQNNGGKVYTYEVDANQLLYPDNVRELPSLHRLSSFQYNENNAKYSLNDYETYQNELNETLNKAKNIGEDFYNNLKNQLDEQKERHPLEYNIYEQTKSRPATNENYNSDFFKEHRSDYDGKSGTHTADGRLTVMHLQKGDNLAKLSFTENQDKIWIDELYVKNQKQGYGSEIVNAIKDYAEKNGKYVEAFKELETAKGFWDKTLRNNTKYSLTKDSQGRTLTKQQQEYFKDSKVVDRDGNLMVMYHGTYYGAGFYFTPYSETAQDYAKSRGDVYETYLNMTNPYIPSADTINEDGSVTFAPTFYEDFENRFKDQLPQYWNDEKTNKGRVVRDILQDNGYDGIINGDTYVVFESEQIKNIDNTNPTTNSDIRYSLSKNALKEVSDVISQTQQDAKESNTQFVKLKDNTPSILVNTGARDLPMLERVGHVRENILTDSEAQKLGFSTKNKHFHGLGVKTYLEIIDAMDNATNLYQYTNDNKHFIVETPFEINGMKAIVPVSIEDNGRYNNVNIDFNRIRTAFDPTPNYIDNLLKNGKIKEMVIGVKNQQASLVDNNIPLNEENVKYSLTKDNKGRELTKEQQKFYKDVSPEVKDDDGNLMRFYHGSNSQFTIFDITKAGESNKNAKVGFWFTPSRSGAENFASDVWYGDNTPTTYEVYLKLKNPKIYETFDNSTQTEKLRSQFNEVKSQEKALYEKYEYENIGLSNVKAFLNYKSEENTLKTLINDFGYTENQAKNYIEDAKKVDEIRKEATKLEKELADSHYTDAYEQFRTDIYKMAGKSAEDANFGGIGMMLDNENQVIQDYVNSLKEQGYDGIVIKGTRYDASTMGGENNQYVVFDSNQIKNVDNLNPTENDDIRYSMQQQETPITPGTRTTMGELFNNIAPIREDLSNIREQMNNLSNQLETMQESLENTSESTNRGYVEPFREQKYENESYTPLTEEEADLYQNALLNDEAYRRSVDEQADFEENNTKLINKLTDDVQSRLALDKKQKSTLESIIKDAVDNDLTTDEIVEKLTRQFKQQEEKYTNDEIKEVKKSIKRTAIKVSDGIKKDIADYGDFQRRNLNKITFSRNGLPVDVAYQALQEQQPGYFPDDIINPTDQLLRISDVANMANEIVEKYDVPQDVFEDIADYIKESILDDEYNSQMEREASLDTDIRMNFTEDIAPATIRSQESIDDFIENRDIAPVREDTSKQRNKSELRDRFDNMRRKFSEMVTNRNFVIDETARATGNNEIKYAGDNRNNVSGETQYNINNKQTDINGKWVGKGLNEIFAPAKNEGLADVFNDYLFHKSNIERHNVGKGSEVPSIVSQQLVAKYEQQYPQVKEWIKDLYKFEDNLLQEQVDSGIITQEKYDDYRGEHGIYRSYVPFYTGNIERSRYFDDEGNIRPVSTLKKSKGGAGDVNTMLSMEEAIARQVYASKRAIRDNELYKEIVSSLEKYEDMMDQDVRDNPTNLDDSLYITPDGEYVLSAYFDGEKVSAKISEELYNELAGTNENRIRQIEEDFSLITNPLQKVSNVRRNLLTTWNPTFLARNAIKDIQDAVINSKYTGDMLANYFGTKKGSKSAIMELREAKTETAQQFLALYGADNLYGDYSNVGKSNKLVNKFSRINELIELAPRYAEFKATLENGGTINEAIYNAREVTTNFGRGGYITKALNRNGFTFLNANVQGLNKLIRNLSGENGAKGVTSVVAKGVAFALLPSILNHLLYGTGDDKDEEYDALPDYIKDNYYLIKLESGKFLRIPKGRINAVFGSAARRSIEALEGESDAFKGYGSNAWSQIGVGDLGSNNIFTPLTQAFGSKNGTAWYGGDIVPTRLQNVPAGEQTDASIDAISNIIGETFGISPYKINYVLDQYSGGIGDVLLPMITEETTSGAENPLEYLTAPIKDSFVVNSTDDNKYAGEFYDTKDKLQIQSNSQNATDEDILKYKYMETISKQLSDLYKERREVQADTTLGNKEKYAKVQAIQNEINSLAKEAMNTYDNFSNTENYSGIGDFEYYKNDEGKWTKVSDDEMEFTAGLNDAEKTAYYKTKNKISGITQEYTAKTKNLDKDSPLKQQYSAERKENITRTIINSGLDNYTKAMVYSKYYSNKDTMTNVVNAGYNVDTYITALSDIEALRTKYSQKNGYSTAQRKAKTMAYINSLDMNIPQKAMLTRRYYSSFRTYNKDIVNYVSNLDITQDEKVSILKDMGMTVKGNKVSWK